MQHGFKNSKFNKECITNKLMYDSEVLRFDAVLVSCNGHVNEFSGYFTHPENIVSKPFVQRFHLLVQFFSAGAPNSRGILASCNVFLF